MPGHRAVEPVAKPVQEHEQKGAGVGLDRKGDPCSDADAKARNRDGVGPDPPAREPRADPVEGRIDDPAKPGVQHQAPTASNSPLKASQSSSAWPSASAASARIFASSLALAGFC